MGTAVAVAVPSDTSQSEKQAEYQLAKDLSMNPPPPGNNCASLLLQIAHAAKVAMLYAAWDAKWWPGRHCQKIQEWNNRVNRLQKEYDIRCKSKCKK